MTVIVDCTELHKNPIRTGIQRVVRELLRNWPADAPKLRLARFGEGHLFPISEAEARILIFEDGVVNKDPSAIGEELAILAANADPIILSSEQLVLIPEVFFDASRANFYEKRLVRNPHSVALLAYDFLPWLRPEFFGFRSASPLMNYLRLVRDTRHVAFISHQTRHEYASRILRRPNVEAGPVLPLGADGLALERQTWHAARQTFVALGSIDGRKNQDKLVAAFRSLWDRNIRAPLTLVGRAFESIDRGWLEEAQLHQDFQWIPNADDTTVAAILRNARATLYVSDAEGFGLPPVESLWTGIPVISTANIPSMMMLPARGHIRLQSADPALIADAVETLLDDATIKSLWLDAQSINLTTWGEFGASAATWISGLSSDFIDTHEGYMY